MDEGKAPEFRVEEDPIEKTTWLVRFEGEVRKETKAFFRWSKHGRQGAFQAASGLGRQLVSATLEKVA